MNDILSVKKLCKVYPGKRPFTAVDEISFDMKKGEILGLLGCNGAGKTTTIQMLLSTLKPTSGSIFYFGKNFFVHRSEILQQVAFASTYVSLPWMLTVHQNLTVFARLYGMTRQQRQERIDPLLERFEITKKKNAPVAQLSAGQITRLMLVKAFMVRPKIVLLDEPTASLDPDIAQDVVAFILEQREQHGISILYTSHNMVEVAEVCDRVLFLQNGKIVADDDPEHLARSVSSCRIQLIVSNGINRIIEIVEKLGMLFKVEHRLVEIQLDEHQIAVLLSALAQAGVDYTHIKIIHPTLNDYFLHMIEQNKKGGGR